MSEILGVLFAILVGTMVIPRFIQYQQVSNDNIRAAITAQQQKEVIDAATAYIKQYSTTIEATATATTPAIITIAMLKAPTVALLDPSFSATNPYGQTWQVEVLEPTAGNLQALVMSTAGTAMLDSQASKIAALVGASGGVIPANDSGIYAGGAANASGTYGGWKVSTANYTSVSGGHLAALLRFNNGQLASNYLYRSAVPGQPQLNQMNTALGMQGNNINNAGAINGVSANISGTVTAGLVTVPAGNNLKVGSSTYYGDSTNSAIRQSGDLYVQNAAGSGYRGINAGNINANGTVLANGGAFEALNNSWAITAYTAGGSANAAPQSATGSAYLNDVYLRSVGKWVSQLQSLGDGQTWVNETGARCVFCTFYNTTGRPIFVNVSIDSSSGGQITGYLYVNGVVVSGYNAYNQRFNNASNFSAIVPNGDSYYLSLSGSNNRISYWSELR